MPLAYAERDQEVLLGWRGHFDLRNAHLLLDERYVERVDGGGYGPWSSFGPFEMIVEPGPSKWVRLDQSVRTPSNAARAVLPPLSRPPAVVPPCRQPHSGQPPADGMRDVEPPTANPLPLCTEAASPSPPREVVPAAAPCVAAPVLVPETTAYHGLPPEWSSRPAAEPPWRQSRSGRPRVDAASAPSPPWRQTSDGLAPADAASTARPSSRWSRGDPALVDAASAVDASNRQATAPPPADPSPPCTGASAQAGVGLVPPDPREPAGVSSAVARGAAPDASALEANPPRGVASEHARVGLESPDGRRRETRPKTTDSEPERPRTVPAMAPASRPAPVPLLVKQALDERARWLARWSHRDTYQMDAQAVSGVLNQMKDKWIQSVGAGAGTTSQERKMAFQRHLHTTEPCSEKAIRLAIGSGIGDVEVLRKLIHADAFAHTITPRAEAQGCRSCASDRGEARKRARRTEANERYYLWRCGKCTACGWYPSEKRLRDCDHCSWPICEWCMPEGRCSCWRWPETDRVFHGGEPDRPCSCNGHHNSS